MPYDFNKGNMCSLAIKELDAFDADVQTLGLYVAKRPRYATTGHPHIIGAGECRLLELAEELLGCILSFIPTMEELATISRVPHLTYAVIAAVANRIRKVTGADIAYTELMPVSRQMVINYRLNKIGVYSVIPLEHTSHDIRRAVARFCVAIRAETLLVCIFGEYNRPFPTLELKVVLDELLMADDADGLAWIANFVAEEISDCEANIEAWLTTLVYNADRGLSSILERATRNDNCLMYTLRALLGDHGHQDNTRLCRRPLYDRLPDAFRRAYVESHDDSDTDSYISMDSNSP
jgi:hypothetical protein